MAKVMTQEAIVNYLRNNLIVGEPNYAHYHSDYAMLTDETLAGFIQVAATRDFPGVDVSKGIPNASVYPIILGAKREILWLMCSKYAPLYDIKALQTTLMREQAFKHYQALLTLADREYNDYLANGGTGGGDDGGGEGEDGDQGYGSGKNYIKVRRVTSDRDYWGRRGHLYGPRPQVQLFVDDVGADYIEVSWNFPRYVNFWKLFLVAKPEDGPVFDRYRFDRPTSGSWIVMEWHKFTERGWRIENLLPGTYSLGIKYFEANGLHAISEEQGILVGEENVGDQSGQRLFG